MNSSFHFDLSQPNKISIHSKTEESKVFDSSLKENIIKNDSSSDPAAYKKKKTLKLLTSSNASSEDPDKLKLFTPQPQNTINEARILFLNSIGCLSYPPTRKLKPQNSQELHDFFYQDEVYEVIMKKCGNKSQEDRFCAKMINKKDSFFGVFDGHGNSLCSELLSDVVHKYIESQENYEIDTCNAIKNACRKLDEELVNLLQKNNLKGGSTALMSLIKDNKLYNINIGDSIGVLINKKEIIQLNCQHTPQNEEERKKLDSLGALLIEKNKVWRVLGELAVSRSFGDKNYKDFIDAEPDITIYDLEENKYDFLMMATDGYWNLVSIQDTYNLFLQWLSMNAKEKLCEFLMSEAESRMPNFRKDNMTMIVVNLNNLRTMKQISAAEYKNKKNIPTQIFFEFNSDGDGE